LVSESENIMKDKIAIRIPTEVLVRILDQRRKGESLDDTILRIIKMVKE
jgi:hypothetical protein